MIHRRIFATGSPQPSGGLTFFPTDLKTPAAGSRDASIYLSLLYDLSLARETMGNGPQYMEISIKRVWGQKTKSHEPMSHLHYSRAGDPCPDKVLNGMLQWLLRIPCRESKGQVLLSESNQWEQKSPHPLSTRVCLKTGRPPERLTSSLNLGNAFHHGCWTQRTRCPSK